MYTKIGCTHVCICTDVRQCTVLLKCTYTYLKKYMYLKSFFIQKYPLLTWLCIHFLQSQPRGRGSTRLCAGEDASIDGLLLMVIWPRLPCLNCQRGRWRVVLYFLFSPTFTFIWWPSFNSIFHNWLYSPVAKTLDLSLRSLPKSHGSNPGQDRNFENFSRWGFNWIKSYTN